MIDFGLITTRPCENVPVPPDPRCNDPAFAAANPDICPPPVGLIIKPGVVLACVLGSVQFKAFTVISGVETDVTDQAVFASSDMNIAVIGAGSGNATATGIQAGEVTISATFQGKMAHSTLTVLAGDNNCCSNTEVALSVLVDNSLSMSQIFNGSYATKLAYARAAATRFIGEINGLKDLVGLDSFNSDSVITLSTPSHDQASVAALVPTIAQTQSDTAFFTALQQAIDELNATTANLKVLLVISDGLATTSEAADPFGLLTNFKSQGGVVMCLGVRAAPAGFAALASFATPGFFVNAYNGVEADALNFISGLKGYICAGNCTPAGDVIVNKGQLDYRDFINWDVVNGDSTVLSAQCDYADPDLFFRVTTGVPHGFITGDQITLRGDWNFGVFNGTFTITVLNATQFTCPTINHGSAFGIRGMSARKDPIPGSVDLQGNGFFDYLPGNGLYVDLISGLDATPPFNGQLVSKQTFEIRSGNQYSLTVSLAGNQLISRAADTVAIQIYYLNGADKVYLLNQQVNLSDYRQPFSDYSFSITAADTVRCWVAIQQLDIPTEDPSSGVLLGRVTLDDLTDLVTMLDDDFDSENPVYVPPRCGLGTTYVFIQDLNAYGYEYGYNCYGTGCLDSPPPIQQPDPNPQTDIESGAAPGPVTYTSTQSATAACDNGFSNLAGCDDYGPPETCTTVEAVTTNFGSGVFLFQYKLFASLLAIAYSLTRKPGSGTGPPAAWSFEGSNDGSSWTTIDTQSGQVFTSGEAKTFYVSPSAAYQYYRIVATSGAPSETLFKVYAGGPQQASGTATATSIISQADADNKARAAALAIAQAKLNCQVTYTSTKSYTATCGIGVPGSPGTVTASATRVSTVSQADADDRARAAAQADAQSQLVCQDSNNQEPIAIPDRGSDPGPMPGYPYPSFKNVTGLTGPIANVTVDLFQFRHTWPSDVCVVLKSPAGTTCVLMAGCGNGGFAVTLVDLHFDDGGGPLPNVGLITSGTYAPTTYGTFADVPAPGPISPYGTTLSVFNGEDPNGYWTLWVCDEETPNDGAIDGGWDITIT